MEHFKEVFSDESGRLSSNRVIGFVIVLVGLAMNLAGYDVKASAGVLSSGVYLLLGGQAKSGLVSGAASVGAYFSSQTTTQTQTQTKITGGPKTVTGPTTKGDADAKPSS